MLSNLKAMPIVFHKMPKQGSDAQVGTHFLQMGITLMLCGTSSDAWCERQTEAIEKFAREVMDKNVPLFCGVLDDPYELMMPSGEIEFVEMKLVRWEGNWKRVVARDSKFWYFIRYDTS